MCAGVGGAWCRGRYRADGEVAFLGSETEIANAVVTGGLDVLPH